MVGIFAQSINNSAAPVSAVGGWPKAIAVVAMAWTILVLAGWLAVTLIRAAAVIRTHRGEDGWE